MYKAQSQLDLFDSGQLGGQDGRVLLYMLFLGLTLPGLLLLVDLLRRHLQQSHWPTGQFKLRLLCNVYAIRTHNDDLSPDV